MNTHDIGKDYLDALADAREARKKLDTNDGDNYDPCGNTAERCKKQFDEAVLNLAKATKAMLGLVT